MRHCITRDDGTISVPSTDSCKTYRWPAGCGLQADMHRSPPLFTPEVLAGHSQALCMLDEVCNHPRRSTEEKQGRFVLILDMRMADLLQTLPKVIWIDSSVLHIRMIIKHAVITLGPPSDKVGDAKTPCNQRSSNHGQPCECYKAEGRAAGVRT